MDGAVSYWDETYQAASGGLFGDAPNDYVRMTLARPGFAARSALCLADGDGRNGSWLAGQGLQVTAVDLSVVATEKAYARDRQAGVKVERITADLSAWTFAPGRSWDAVFLIYLHGPASVRRRAIELGVSALKPGGWFVAEGFSRAQTLRGGMGPSDPENAYDLNCFDFVRTKLDLVEALSGCIRLDEGRRHSGLGDIIRYTAIRKLA